MNPISIVIAVLLVAPAPKPDEGSLARTLIDQADVARARGDDPSAVSHLRAALQAAQSAESIAEEAAASVRLMEVTRASADLAMAEPLVARALALAPGGTAAEADALRLLGAVSAAAGDRASAETSLRQAVEVAELALGPGHERLAPALCDLGMILVGNGHLPEAEARLRRCLSIDDASATQAVDRRARQVFTLEILASLAIAKGEAAESEALMRRAVALSTLEPSLGPADVADALNGLANAVIDRGRTREAGRLARRALALYERVHDGRHAEVTEVLVTLAAVRATAGEADQAVTLLRRAARVAEHENARPVVKAGAAANLGALWMSQGHYQDAEPLLEQALELGEQAVGTAHPGLLRPLQMLADCYRLRGRFPEAGALYERALGLAGRAYGVRSVAAMTSLSGLAAVEEQAGHRQRAEMLHRDAVAIAEDVADARDPARIEVLASLAAFFERQGQSGPAEHLYVKAVAAAEHVGASDPRRVAALRGLASLYAGQGRRAEASRIQRALEEPAGIASLATSWVAPSAEHP